MKKCWITGMGAVTPIGLTVPDFWTALCAGRTGIGPLTVFDTTDFTYTQAGQIAVDPVLAYLDSGSGTSSRALRFVLAAADEAIAQSGLLQRGVNPELIAVVLSTNFGSIEPGATIPFQSGGFMGLANAVANRFGFAGPRTVLSLSCSSGAAALGYGMSLIRTGRAAAVLAGGVDELTPYAWSGLSALRTMTRTALRPFDKRRDGTLFSEGAGLVLLEESDSAEQTGATRLAEAAGWATNNNAHHMTAPAPLGAGSAEVMAMALADAGVPPSAVDHVNAHGTGTRFNDSTETQAIKTVLGDHAYSIPITANKSVLGHMLGAAGSVEAIAAVMTIRDGVVPPTINYGEADQECDLDCVPNAVRRHAVHVALSNSAGIGGCNAALVLK